MLAGSDFDLNYFELAGLNLGFGGLLLFLFIVQILAIIHDLGYWGSSRRGYLNQIQSPFLSLSQSDGERDNTEIFSFGGYDAQLRRFDLMIDFDADSQLIGIIVMRRLLRSLRLRVAIIR